MRQLACLRSLNLLADHTNPDEFQDCAEEGGHDFLWYSTYVIKISASHLQETAAETRAVLDVTKQIEERVRSEVHLGMSLGSALQVKIITECTSQTQPRIDTQVEQTLKGQQTLNGPGVLSLLFNSLEVDSRV